MGGALVLYSGGLDSLTLLYFVKKKLNYDSILALGFDYGQPHVKELQYVALNCKKLRVPFIVRKITGLQVGDMVTSPEVVGRNSLFLTYGAIVAKENGLMMFLSEFVDQMPSGFLIVGLSLFLVCR